MAKELEGYLIPTYTSHKRVKALQIATCVSISLGNRLITFADAAYPGVTCPAEMFARYVPVRGDFYVIYEDGYTSISPRAQFLAGYSPVVTPESFADIKRGLRIPNLKSPTEGDGVALKSIDHPEPTDEKTDPDHS